MNKSEKRSIIIQRINEAMYDVCDMSPLIISTNHHNKILWLVSKIVRIYAELNIF